MYFFKLTGLQNLTCFEAMRNITKLRKEIGQFLRAGPKPMLTPINLTKNCRFLGSNEAERPLQCVQFPSFDIDLDQADRPEIHAGHHIIQAND